MISFKRTKNRGFDLAILERAYVPNIASIDLEEFETATKPLHNVAGIYILYNKTSVYIGQAANLLSRLKDHKKNKIEFTKALVCFKNDENDDFLFDKGILDYLERSCISIVKERVSPGVFITNKNIGNTSPLEPSRKSKMGPVLGYMTEVLEHEYIIDYVIDQKLVQDKEIFVKITKDEDLPLPDKMDIVPLDFIEEKIKPIVDDAIDDEKLSEILVVQSASLLFPVVDKPNVNITFISTCEAGVLYAEEFSKQTGKELNIIKTTKDEFLSDLDMKTKFDIIISNPPYTKHLEILQKLYKILSGELIMIHPASWMTNQFKGKLSKNREQAHKLIGNDFKSITLVNGGHVFNPASPGLCSITHIVKDHNNKILHTDLKGNIRHFDNINIPPLFDPITIGILDKLKSYCTISGNSFKDDFNNDVKIKNNKPYHIPMVYSSGNFSSEIDSCYKGDFFQILYKSNNQVCNLEKIKQNKLNQNTISFDDKEIAEGICTYLRESKLAKICMMITKYNQRASYSYNFLPKFDFTKYTTDEDFYKVLKLTQEEITFIEKVTK